MIQVEPLQHGRPIVGVFDLLRLATQLLGEPFVFISAALAQRLGVVLQQLFFPQQTRVALLADSPFAARLILKSLQKVGEDLHGASGDPAPIGELTLQLLVVDFVGQNFADVA